MYEKHFQTLKYGWVILIFENKSTIMQMPPIQLKKQAPNEEEKGMNWP